MAIQGITVQLIKKVEVGKDPFNEPIYDTVSVDVQNVLVSPMSDEEILETLNLTGRKASYQLAVPKDDTNEWEGQKVGFFGETWRVIGKPTKGIDNLIPLGWNLKVKVESVIG